MFNSFTLRYSGGMVTPPSATVQLGDPTSTPLFRLFRLVLTD